MQRLSLSILMATLLSLAFPVGAHAAVQSGGGFSVNGQVNVAPGALSGGGITAISGSDLAAQIVSGNGYLLMEGIAHVSAAESTTSDSPSDSDTPPSGGGGGGGGGGIGRRLPIPPPQSQDNVSTEVFTIIDFNILIVNWGSEICGNAADKDGDCLVGIQDFNYLLVHWGAAV